ncbi:MAG: lipid-A-disaccharide synthase [Acidobacteriota bacterium]|jgi:lipid-A-disaccharide synthase
MAPTVKRLLVVAGETSGDLHAANLVAALHRQHPEVMAFGVAGERMRAAGVEALAGVEELSVMGLAEVVRELPRLVSLARRVRRQALARRPDAAVLVDAPDFNLPLARHLHRAGVPVVVYISPQLWAWRAGRVRRLRRDVDQVLSILPFEVEFFSPHGVAVEYVGHPLVDELHQLVAAPPPRQHRTLALLPGSRWQEVGALLPEMARAAGALRREDRSLRVALLVAPGLEVSRVRGLLGEAAEWVELVVHDRHAHLAAASAALVASGTATLECALLDVPMVVAYRLHPLTYALARRLVRLPHVSLVNLVAGRSVVPELLQRACTWQALAAAAGRLFSDDGERQRRELQAVRDRLGPPGASARAAAAVARLLGLSSEASPS